MSRIDHIGIATNNINEASKFWHEIGLDSGEDHINLEQDVKIRMFYGKDENGNKTYSKVELIEALSENSPIAKFILKKGVGIQQLAISVNVVACNERIREMARLMCKDRGATAFWPEKQYCVDNGTMIAELGRKMLKHDIYTKLEDSAIDPSMRTDHAEVVWD